MNKLEVIEHKSGNYRRPFRIIEIYPCLDGHRTRFTHHCFKTMDEALLFIVSQQL